LNVWPTEDQWKVEPEISDCASGDSCWNLEFENSRTGPTAFNPAQIGIVTEITASYWWPKGMSMEYIGGFLGIGQGNMTYDEDNGIWYSGHQFANNFWKTAYDWSTVPPYYPFLFAIYLKPEPDSYQFLPTELQPDFSKVNNQTSTIMF